MSTIEQIGTLIKKHIKHVVTTQGNFSVVGLQSLSAFASGTQSRGGRRKSATTSPPGGGRKKKRRRKTAAPK
jgi:hypothetical protein